MKLEIPELYELLDERDRIRSEPVTECSIRDLNAVEFLISLRRGKTGNMVMNAWERDMHHYYLTAGIHNETK
jgi:hypothetical protein